VARPSATRLAEPNIAKVDLDAELVFEGISGTQQVTGPAYAMKTSTGWRVLDYVRNGRSQQDAIFTEVSGTQEKNGVIVRVVAVVLQEAYTDVFIRVKNTSNNKASISEGTVIDAGGAQHSGGFSEHSDVAGDATLTTDFYFDGVAIPLKTKRLRLSLTGDSGPPNYNPLDYDFEVKMAS
jgi:hypothetical protein